MEEEGLGPNPIEKVKTHASVLSLRTFRIITVIIIGVGLIYHYQLLGGDSDNCYSLMKNGHWVDHRWYPYRCVINRYPTDNFLQSYLSQSYVLFMGDKSLLHYYTALANRVTMEGDPISPPTDIEKNIPLTFTTPDKLYTSDFVWTDTLNQDVIDYYHNMFKNSIGLLPNVIVHQHFDFKSVSSSCSDLVSQLIDLQTSYITKYKRMINTTTTSTLNPAVIMLLDDTTSDCQSVMEQLYEQKMQINPFMKDHLVLLHLDSLQIDNFNQGLEVLIHFLYSSQDYSSCCFTNSNNQYYRSTIIPILFVLLTLYVGVVFVRATGTLIPLEPYFEGASVNLDSIYIIIHMFGLIIVSLFYSSITDRLEYFSIASPVRSVLLCSLLLLVVICVGFIKRLDNPSEYLPWEHLQEWRGWSVMVLVVLEYTEMTETQIGSWVWIAMIAVISTISGYSNFIYFWNSGDFSFKNITKRLFNHNYLTIWFCLTLGFNYGLYVVPCVMTQAVIVVFVTMATPPILTSQYKKAQWKDVVIKLTCGFILAFILTSIELLVMDRPFTSYSVLNLDDSWRNGQLWTTPYVARLMAFLGMGLAYHFKVNQSPPKYVTSINIIKGIFVILSTAGYSMFVLLAGSVNGYTQLVHAVLLPPLVLSYVYIRNWIPYIRTSYSYLFKYFGSMAIEFYVLFQHLMMCYNTKGIVYMFPSFYSLNLISTLLVLLYLSVVLHEQTKELSHTNIWLTPSNNEKDEEE